MKKLLSALLIVSLICSTYKEAEAVAIPVAAVVVGSALLLTAAGTACYSNPSTSAAASAAVSAAGNYYRAVDAYTQAVTAYGKQQLYKDAATIAVAGQALIDAVQNAASGTYDALKNALFPTEPTVPAPTIPTGSYVQSGAGDIYRTLAPPSKVYSNTSINFDTPWPKVVGSTMYIYSNLHYVSVTPYADVYTIPVVADSSGTPINGAAIPTPADLPAKLAPNGSVPADVADEMDDLIKNNPSIATPTAGATATGTAALDDSGSQVPPYVPVLPDGVSTTPPDTVTGLGAQTLADAQARLAAAQQALAEAQAAAAADPASLPLQQAVTTAQTAVANATQAVTNADEAASETYQTPVTPPRKGFNFDKWKQLIGLMSTVWPFTLLSTLSDYFDLFVVTPVAPSFDLHIYQDKKIHIDLSPFDPVALILRWSLAILFSFGSVQVVIKWWRGVS